MTAAGSATHEHRLLVFSHSAGVMGAERALVTEVRALVRWGIAVRVIVPGRGPAVELLREAGAEVVRCPLTPWMARKKAWPIFMARLAIAILTFPRLVYLTRQFRPCMTYSNSWVIPQGAITSKLLRIPHVWHIREYEPGNETLRTQLPLGRIRRWTSQWSRDFLAVSGSVAEQFDGLPVRIRVVHVGVDWQMPEVRDRNPWLQDARPAVLLLGTISRAKGALVAVEAMARLRELVPTARLLIVGDGARGVVQEVHTRVRDLALEKTVRVEPFDPAPAALIEQSDVVLVPSKHEAYGLVTLEAMSSGTPVVGAASGATRELLRGGGGLLAAVDDAQHFAAHIAAIAEDPALRDWLSARGVATAQQFDKDAEAVAVRELLDEVCARRA
jgi:glycosyltransferase involved in cell wall biosynthesis